MNKVIAWIFNNIYLFIGIIVILAIILLICKQKGSRKMNQGKKLTKEETIAKLISDNIEDIDADQMIRDLQYNLNIIQ